jgi:hypothetical protein
MASLLFFSKKIPLTAPALQPTISRREGNPWRKKRVRDTNVAEMASLAKTNQVYLFLYR